jgi:hypothetical protein
MYVFLSCFWAIVLYDGIGIWEDSDNRGDRSRISQPLGLLLGYDRNESSHNSELSVPIYCM